MATAQLIQVAVFLAAAAIAAPLGRASRMGAVLGYLAAGRDHRPLRARPILRARRRRQGPAFRRVRRGDAAVRDRARASPGQAVGHALGDLRARHGAADHHGACAGSDRNRARARHGPGSVHRPRARALLDGVRAAGARGEGRAHHPSRQARLLRAAVPGPGRDPADRSRAALRARRRQADHGFQIGSDRHPHHCSASSWSGASC